MRRQSGLDWGDAPLPRRSAERQVKVHRFNGGAHSVVVLLGDLVERYVHWDDSFGHTIPCHEIRHKLAAGAVSVCPKCNELGPTDRRAEGYGPAMWRHERKKQWEQVVAVFTEGALNQLDLAFTPPPYRGRVFDVWKEKQGTSWPMKLKELAPLHPDEFPAGLPAAFDTRPIMEQVWSRFRIPDLPVTFIDPVPFRRKQRESAAPSRREHMEVSLGVLAQMRQNGLHRLADAATVKQEPAPTPAPTPDSVPATTSAQPPAPEPPPAPPARRPAAARRASPGDSPESPSPSDTPVSPLPTNVTPLEGPDFGPTLDGLDGVISMNDVINRGVGSIICRDESKRIPPTHPASRNGHHTTNGKGKGGDQ